MARPKREDKRNAILAAATKVFSERGLSAPTSAISVEAGVAEGTLFTYFKSKDALVNALYREVKMEMADAMMSGFPRRASVRHRMQHVWNQYVDWGFANPLQQKVMKEIEVWGGLTGESRAAGQAPFGEIRKMAEDAVAERLIADLPQEFVAAAMTALAETTMAFMRGGGEEAALYRSRGFEMLWAGIARR